MNFTYYPSRVIQTSSLPDQEIGWTQYSIGNSEYLLGSRWKTNKPLLHISNPATGDLRNSTWTLTCTGFNIPLLNTITGIKLNVKARRNGRIVDDIIQLTYQGSAIGANNFSYITDSEGHFLLLNDTYYGGEFDLWESEVTPSMLTDPSFGIILKFQSHPFYPHNCEMYLDSVSLTVYSI
jgi:hypothetical protein